jgi:hypothetical protein
MTRHDSEFGEANTTTRFPLSRARINTVGGTEAEHA